MTRPGPPTGPITLHDFSAQLSGEEWTLLQDWQKDLYRNVMKEIHQAMISLGYKIHGTLLQMNGGEQFIVPDVQVKEKSRDTSDPNSGESDLSLRIIGEDPPSKCHPYTQDSARFDDLSADQDTVLGESGLSLRIIGEDPPSKCHPYTQDSARFDDLSADQDTVLGNPDVAVMIIGDELQPLTLPLNAQECDTIGEPCAGEIEVSVMMAGDGFQSLTSPNTQESKIFEELSAGEPELAVRVIGDEPQPLAPLSKSQQHEGMEELAAEPPVQISIKGEVESFAMGHQDSGSARTINSPTEPMVIPTGVQFRLKEEGGPYSENHQDCDFREVIFSPTGDPEDSFGINREETHGGPGPENQEKREPSGHFIPEQLVVPGTVLPGFKEEAKPCVIGRHHPESSGVTGASEGDGSMVKWSLRNSAKCNDESTLFNTTTQTLRTRKSHSSERKIDPMHPMSPEKDQGLREKIMQQESECNQYTYLRKRTDCTQRSDAYRVPKIAVSSVGVQPCDLNAQQSLSLHSYPENEQTVCQNVRYIRVGRTPCEHGRYACAKCDKEFSAKSKRVRHEQTHTGERPYKCIQCGKSFSEKGIFLRHLNIHTGVKPHQCNKCEKSFSESAVLIRHQKIHAGEQPYDCSECGQSFCGNRLLTRHQKRHRRTNLNQSTPSPLGDNDKEVQIHTEDKPYYCSACGENFIQKRVFSRHQQLHKREKKNYDCMTCGKSFTKKWLLSRHQKLHTRETPPLRPLLAKPLHDEATLSRHQNVSAKRKPHECADCGKIFSRRDSLVRHQKKHPKEFSFEFEV
ncbi:uncharacterized protein LOC144770911 isoform X2 [Lissotriton helveticus]